MDYKVITPNAPFFRWRSNQQKAREGNLAAGFKLNGEPYKTWLVVQHALPGAQELPPYVLYLTDVQRLDGTPTDDSETRIICSPGSIQIHGVIVDGDGKIIGEYTWQNDQIVELPEASG